jgi:hypothetical protein
MGGVTLDIEGLLQPSATRPWSNLDTERPVVVLCAVHTPGECVGSILQHLHGKKADGNQSRLGPACRSEEDPAWEIDEYS